MNDGIVMDMNTLSISQDGVEGSVHVLTHMKFLGHYRAQEEECGCCNESGSRGSQRSPLPAQLDAHTDTRPCIQRAFLGEEESCQGENVLGFFSQCGSTPFTRKWANGSQQGDRSIRLEEELRRAEVNREEFPLAQIIMPY